MTFHLADDIIRGMASGQISNFPGVVILVIWLYGTLVLAERHAGYIITPLGSLLRLGIPVIHMMGKGVGVSGNVAKSNWSLLLRLDAPRARRDRALLRHPLGARTVDPEMGPAPLIQQPQHGNARRRAEVTGADF
jgi:hypothetical protein